MESLDQFQIEQELFPGKQRKFARVFKGRRKSDDGEVLIKTCTKTSSNSHLSDRLRQERDFHFDFPGLPKILAFLETDSEIILVKKWEVGTELHHFVRKFKPRDRARELASILDKLTPILNHIHQQDIVHLDLKPHNILVHVQDKELSVSLLDFGMAIRKPVQEHRKMLFPLGYASPECLLNHLDLCDQRSDYFSLGITLWQCVEGRLPLLHANPSITTNLQLTHPLPDGDVLTKQQSRLLQKLAAKHVFALPPNAMDQTDVRKSLIAGMELRYSTLNEFLHDWKEAGARKKWRLF